MTHQPQRYLMPMNSASDDWTIAWFREIGAVGYYFGQMEWAPYLLADHVGCSQTKRRKMPSMSFSQRCIFAKIQLLPQLSDHALRTEWAAVLDEISGCAKMRNAILHNPLELNVNEIEANGIKVHQGIRLLKKHDKTLLIGDVQHFTKTMIDLHRRTIALLARTPPHA